MRADIRELVRKLLSSKKAMTAAAALGIMGMLMILFSGGDKNENTVQTQDVPESASWSDYSTQTEERLEPIRHRRRRQGKSHGNCQLHGGICVCRSRKARGRQRGA